MVQGAGAFLGLQLSGGYTDPLEIYDSHNSVPFAVHRGPEYHERFPKQEGHLGSSYRRGLGF